VIGITRVDIGGVRIMVRRALFCVLPSVLLFQPPSPALAHEQAFQDCAGYYTIFEKSGPISDGMGGVYYSPNPVSYWCANNNGWVPAWTEGEYPDIHNPSPEIFNYCGMKCVPKRKACPTPATDGCVGDPVDLVTGYLEQSVVDVDLGHGLWFERVYSSGLQSSTAQFITEIGRNWRHNLLVTATRSTWTSGGRRVSIRDADGVLHNFFRPSQSVWPGTGFTAASSTGGSLIEEADATLRWTDPSGTTHVFDASNKRTSIQIPGEPTITVSHTADTSTFSNGLATMVLTRFAAGHPNAGKISSVSANGQTTSFTYDSNHLLLTATVPDLGTPSPGDTIVTTYTYGTLASSSAPARLGKIERTARGVTEVLGNWIVGTSRQVTQADEPALDQLLKLSYSVGTGGWKYTAVKDAPGTTLATYAYQNGQLRSVSGDGGPGVEPPFVPPTSRAAASGRRIARGRTGTGTSPGSGPMPARTCPGSSWTGGSTGPTRTARGSSPPTIHTSVGAIRLTTPCSPARSRSRRRRRSPVCSTR
jgi:YD repeat-containing protein